MANGWDSSTLKKLKTLFGRGLSTSEIGRKLGLSKNAVVGKINRLGWNSEKKSKPVTKGETSAQKTKSKASTKPTTKSTTKVPAKQVAQKTKKTVATTKKTQTVKPTPKVKEKTTGQVKATKPIKTTVAPEKTKTASKKTNRDLAVHQRIIQHSLEMAALKPNQCRWPIGDPDSEHFHFCGATVFTGKPYCYEHCRQAYQFTPPKKK